MGGRKVSTIWPGVAQVLVEDQRHERQLGTSRRSPNTVWSSSQADQHGRSPWTPTQEGRPPEVGEVLGLVGDERRVSAVVGEGRGRGEHLLQRDASQNFPARRRRWPVPPTRAPADGGGADEGGPARRRLVGKRMLDMVSDDGAPGRVTKQTRSPPRPRYAPAHGQPRLAGAGRSGPLDAEVPAYDPQQRRLVGGELIGMAAGPLVTPGDLGGCVKEPNERARSCLDPAIGGHLVIAGSGGDRRPCGGPVKVRRPMNRSSALGPMAPVTSV